MLVEYIFVFKYVFLSFLIAFLLFSVSFFLVFQNPYMEKLSSYECGFNPFNDARGNIDVKFFVIAILFIVFDLELSFFFPFVLILKFVTIYGIFSMLFFIFLLTIGFIYEWLQGSLESCVISDSDDTQNHSFGN